jgi:hypothetical protein
MTKLQKFFSGKRRPPVSGRRKFLKSAVLAAAGSSVQYCSQFAPTESERPALHFNRDVTVQNDRVNGNEVSSSLDAMAMALAKKESSEEAWKTIFQKPEKPWSQVKAVVKFNEVGPNMPRVALIDKICRELLALGLSAENITIYGGRNPVAGDIKVYYGLLKDIIPQGIVLSEHDDKLGGQVTTAIPQAGNGIFTISETRCIKDIGDHVNDILINVAANKGHWEEYGGFTLTMKNHFGTFDPVPYPSAIFDESHGNFSYLVSINQCNALIGGPVAQQQLCIVDSLWAGSEPNPGAPGDPHPYNRIVMGTFSPAVDVLTALKIRRDVMGCSPAPNAYAILPAFGYSDNAADRLDFIHVDAGNPHAYSKTDPGISSSLAPQINPEIHNLRVVCCWNEKLLVSGG